MLSYLLDFLIGLVIGLIAGLFGIGGGFLIVPTLTMLGEPIHLAIGTSLACIAISAFASAYTHLRKGTVLFRVVLIKEAFSIPTAVLGAYLSTFFPDRLLKVIFALLLIYLAYVMAKEKRECVPEVGEVNYRRVPVVGVLAGLTSGLLGISGGVLNVPLFHTYIGLPMRYAVGTSSLSLFFTALAGALAHYRLGQVDVYSAIILAPGLIVGARAGAMAVHRLNPVILRKAFAVILVLVALKMML
ncbi:sulfite exporter TauE/SafE family protein [Thermococcus sp.]|uniref:sulfite exporter TauE/SafE family protein n=1 Tax=Thermococcus sp. TaxID=35749 RepID=UPI002631E70B|nr:sulfite exporter TauE/SafE family protein [Thermococcus sp.]